MILRSIFLIISKIYNLGECVGIIRDGVFILSLRDKLSMK